MARPLIKSMATVSGLTFLSRILGFARQLLMAGVIGAGGNPVADAFWAAFRLPNMFRRLLAEGAFQAAFVPLFQGHSKDGDLTDARRFAEDILAWLIVILSVLTALVMIFTPLFVSLITTGFRDEPEKFSLTVLYTRIMFPYLACMSLVGLFGGMLNALHRFAAAAAAPLLLNIILIIGVLAFADESKEVTGLAAAISVMVAGVAQLIALALAAGRSSLLLRLRRPRYSKGVRRMLTLGAPGFIGASALQVNGIVGTNIASREAGAISWLSYADQLYQLPLGVIGIALGIVLMPAISRSVKDGDEQGAHRTLNRGIEIALFFALPAAAALLTLPHFLCSALFQEMAGGLTRAVGAGQSAFTDGDVDATAAALFLYGLGLPAFVMQKVMAAAFFAREDTRSPMTFAFVAIAINATVSISLFPVIGFLSVPLGTILGSWAEVSGLALRLRGRGHLAPSLRFVSRIFRMLIAALAIGLLVVERHREALAAYVFGQEWIVLFATVGVAVLAYAALNLLLGSINLKDLRSARR